MTEQTVYFDIDKTLVDTQKLLQNCRQSLVQIGVLPENFDRAAKAYLGHLTSRTEYNPDDFIATVAFYQPEIEMTDISAAFWLAQNFAEALFPEVLTVLTQLSAHFTLGIFSQGNKDWQRKKLRKTGLAEFFSSDHLIIADYKLSPEIVTLLEENAIVIDDKSEVIQFLKTDGPTGLKPIQIDRQATSSNAQKIASLSALLPLLQL
ncbi:MAG: hypothetical protein COY81_04410 [Candidatus Pacebacteria bacterium CG_4_10_14_0_8_um_filter_43_12]|nr:MAG: hypothetical protein COY81_04410 [Candidatus Pacebacteria bacterium CG_4_10_14_0_8_um_filter_43_12]